jgi:hypothetical protein
MARESALRVTKEAGNTMIRRPETITPILQDLNPQDDYRGIHPEMQNIFPVDHELDGGEPILTHEGAQAEENVLPQVPES